MQNKGFRSDAKPLFSFRFALASLQNDCAGLKEAGHHLLRLPSEQLFGHLPEPILARYSEAVSQQACSGSSST
jgi:hypothetical protein